MGRALYAESAEKRGAMFVHESNSFSMTTTQSAHHARLNGLEGFEPVLVNLSATILERAYKIWTTQKTDCDCSIHDGFIFDGKCPREKAWRTYVRVRDGIAQTEQDKTILGLT